MLSSGRPERQLRHRAAQARARRAKDTKDAKDTKVSRRELQRRAALGKGELAIFLDERTRRFVPVVAQPSMCIDD